MKKLVIILIIIAALAGIVFAVMNKSKTVTYKQPSNLSTNKANVNPMQIQSPVFTDNQTIPAKYTCDGQGINPPLKFSGLPAEAKSLALIVDDPDAPNGDWVHWLVWNVSPATSEILEGVVPKEATEGTTSFGQTGYGGPCPPAGPAHHYHFTLYALSEKLSLPSRTTKQELEQAMNGLVVSRAELIGLYGR